MHIENVDLNLLKALEALLAERHVSRAALRLNLSQSAMSRALARLRKTFGDELLVPAEGGYELTPRARVVNDELTVLLPRLRMMFAGNGFDPRTATNTIRLAASDYATEMVFDDGLIPEFFRRAPRMSLHVEQVWPTTFDDLEYGRVDLVLGPRVTTASIASRTLFVDEYVCVLARDHPLSGKTLTLEDLASYPHARVAILPSERMWVDRRLAELGLQPRSGLAVPFFSTLLAALSHSTMIALVPARYAKRHLGERLGTATLPAEFAPFDYAMHWHPRLNDDPAHRWLRGLLLEVSHAAYP
ncbi:LysR family transcriptional regulator [Kineosporia babensis]|uniref:LysR family transcriptional regulator n=1 Tax=Kineosporia babensis TaxID=499548 RepID=A0A9X1NM18_9ACTN|nr:LysR family transcriptional regulator [Kineosporia babensis]MCD5316628.1 LysR family transcriptional regulator [Kineosporia babensis]